jgi:hypothetical protein
MRRRDLVIGLPTTLVAASGRAFSQQTRKLPRIGVLVSASPPHPFAEALWRGLRPLGYSEGKNIDVEFHYTGGRSERAEELADELADWQVAVEPLPQPANRKATQLKVVVINKAAADDHTLDIYSKREIGRMRRLVHGKPMQIILRLPALLYQTRRHCFISRSRLSAKRTAARSDQPHRQARWQ